MKIGVIGGGQLGRMLALAGTPLGMNFAFLDPAPDACAAALGEHIRADYGDQDHLRQLADEVDLVTFEFESVPAETVAFLSQFVPVYPSADALRIARDRWFEKSMFKDLGIPTPAFADIQSQADLEPRLLRALQGGALCALGTALGAVPVLVIRKMPTASTSTRTAAYEARPDPLGDSLQTD